MDLSHELIEKAKLASGCPTDMAFSKKLGIKHSTLSNWRRGASKPSPGLVWKMCEIAHLNHALYMVGIEADRAIDLETAQAWQRMRSMYIMSAVAAHMRRKRMLTHRL